MRMLECGFHANEVKKTIKKIKHGLSDTTKTKNSAMKSVFFWSFSSMRNETRILAYTPMRGVIKVWDKLRGKKNTHSNTLQDKIHCIRVSLLVVLDYPLL